MQRIALGIAGALAAVASTAAHANASEFRIRIVRMDGDVAVPLTRNDEGCWNLTLPPLQSTVRLRLQVGVFDDANGPAPAGGFVRWDQGAITAPCGATTRTPGRLPPFWFPGGPGHGSNGIPAVDPFTSLTRIDAVFGTQVRPWHCLPYGGPSPLPPPAVIGRNEFVSVFEITHQVDDESRCCEMTFSGMLTAAESWIVAGTPVSPDCGSFRTPVDDIDGSVTYVAVPTVPAPFQDCIRVCKRRLFADWNLDDIINSQDFFDFAQQFFVGDADANLDGVTNSQDFFDFLRCFFSAC